MVKADAYQLLTWRLPDIDFAASGSPSRWGCVTAKTRHLEWEPALPVRPFRRRLLVSQSCEATARLNQSAAFSFQGLFDHSTKPITLDFARSASKIAVC